MTGIVPVASPSVETHTLVTNDGRVFFDLALLTEIIGRPIARLAITLNSETPQSDTWRVQGRLDVAEALVDFRDEVVTKAEAVLLR
jgi:hypothetical protein